MDMRDWLAIIFITGIVLILLDGFRVKWLERKRSLRIKLDKNIPSEEGGPDYEGNHEFPNGGARLVSEDEPPYYGSDEEITEDEDEFDDFVGSVPVLMDAVELEDDDINEEIPDDEIVETTEDTYNEDSEDIVDTEDINEESELDDYEYDLAESEPEEEPDYQGEVEEYEEDDSLEQENYEEPEIELSSNERIEPSFGDDLSEAEFLEEATDETETESVAEIKSELASYTKEDQTDLFIDDTDELEVDDEVQAPPEAQEVIVINVMAKAGEMLAGSDLLPILMQQGMHLGDMSIFHRHGDANGNGPVLFSMANMVEPGTFDVTKMEEFATPGVSFFLQMPNSFGNMQCFEQMLTATNAIKDGLNADLKDEDRNAITFQTLEHCRERVRDFELKQLSNK